MNIDDTLVECIIRSLVDALDGDLARLRAECDRLSCDLAAQKIENAELKGDDDSVLVLRGVPADQAEVGRRYLVKGYSGRMAVCLRGQTNSRLWTADNGYAYLIPGQDN